MQHMKALPTPIENNDSVFEFLLGEARSLSKLEAQDIASLCAVVRGLALEYHQKEQLAVARCLVSARLAVIQGGEGLAFTT